MLFNFVFYTVKKERASRVILILWVLVAFKFFFIANTRHLCNQGGNVIMKGLNMWLDTGWPSLCPHLQAADHPHSGVRILGDEVARPEQGVGNRAGSKQPLRPLQPFWANLSPLGVRPAGLICISPSSTPSMPPCLLPAARPPCSAGRRPGSF